MVETLLPEMQFGLGFDCEFVVHDTRAELADAFVWALCPKKAVKAGDVWLCIAEPHS